MLSIFLIMQFMISDIDVSKTLAFTKYENKQVRIYSCNYDNNKIQFIAEGYEPDLYAEKNLIVYVKESASNYSEIVIYDYKQKTEKKFDFLNIYFCSSPAFSPDGKYLLFFFMINTYKFLKFYENKIDFSNFEYAGLPELIDGWQLGIIDLESNKLIKITDTLYDKIKNYNAPAWTNDSKYILFHDLNNIYKINIEGVIINQYEIGSIIGKDYQKFINSNVYFHLSPDEKYLLFNCSKLSADEYINGDSSPIECAMVYDFNNKDLKRISPKGFLSFNPVWINNGEQILIQGFSILEKPRYDRLLILNLEGKIIKQMILGINSFYFPAR